MPIDKLIRISRDGCYGCYNRILKSLEFSKFIQILTQSWWVCFEKVITFCRWMMTPLSSCFFMQTINGFPSMDRKTRTERILLAQTNDFLSAGLHCCHQESWQNTVTPTHCHQHIDCIFHSNTNQSGLMTSALCFRRYLPTSAQFFRTTGLQTERDCIFLLSVSLNSIIANWTSSTSKQNTSEQATHGRDCFDGKVG